MKPTAGPLLHIRLPRVHAAAGQAGRNITVKVNSDTGQPAGFSRLKLFFALSRTPHGLLDMATPAFAALLWLGDFPPLNIIILGLVTTFAGYTAVYALNDVIDHRVDRQKIDRGGLGDAEDYLDAMMVRHPLARGLLSLKEAMVWAGGWTLAALLGAYLLNPVCVLIFVAGCTLEVVYCLMWRISHLRTIVSGGVKTSGAMAAVFAVDPRPAPEYLLILFLLLFFWEIGGQNIPADWTDIEEDRRMAARTIPVRFGTERANRIILSTLTLAVAINLVLFYRAPARFEGAYFLASLVVGLYLLLIPALRLYRTGARRQAMSLFNKASYYPLTLLLVVLTKIVI